MSTHTNSQQHNVPHILQPTMTVGHLSAAIQTGENRATSEAFPVRDRNEMPLDKVQRAHRSGVTLPPCNVQSRKAKKDAVSALTEVTPEHPSDVSGHKTASHTHTKANSCIACLPSLVLWPCICHGDAVAIAMPSTD